MAERDTRLVHTFGRKKNAVAAALMRVGKGRIKVNGVPIDLVEPAIMRTKILEPILLLGHEKFADYDVKIKVRGGGYTAQIYAIRLALAKSLVAFNQKHVDECSKREIKEILMEYDRNLLVSDPRRCEPKKFGGSGARARKQKSYR